MKGKVRKTLLSIFTVVMIVATNSVGFAATDSKTIAVNDEVKGWPGWKWEYDEKGNKIGVWLSADVTYEDVAIGNRPATDAKLEKITVDENNPVLEAKDGVLFTKGFKELLWYPIGKRDKEYKEPDTVEKSEGYEDNPYLTKLTFSSNSNYTMAASCQRSGIQTVIIPDNIKYIPANAFEMCTDLNEIQWGKSVAVIGPWAFSRCYALKNVNIPKSVRLIGNYAFSHCDSLKKIVIPEGVRRMGIGVFKWTKSLKKITLPESLLYIGSETFASSPVKISKPVYLKKLKKHGMSYSARVAVKNKKGKKNIYPAKQIVKISPVKKSFSTKCFTKGKLKTVVYMDKNIVNLGYLEYTAFDSDGAERHKPEEKKAGYLDASILRFKSGNQKVLKISKEGVWRAVGKGTAIVKVQLRTTKESYKVKIKVKGNGMGNS